MTDVKRLEFGKEPGDRFEIEICGVPFVFRYCPPGEFLMGSPADEVLRVSGETAAWDDDGLLLPDHDLRIERIRFGFWLAETLTTQKQWLAVSDSNPSEYIGDNLPVECVSWHDCREYMKRLAAATQGRYTFDFPNETLWEYACRAGTASPRCDETANDGDHEIDRPNAVNSPPFSFGRRCSGFDCNCDGERLYGYWDTRKRVEKTSLFSTSPVKSYPPNP